MGSLLPLRHLVELRRCWLVGDGTECRRNALDFADLSNLSNLEELRVTYAGSVQSVAPLVELESLRDLRLRGTRIISEDSALFDVIRERMKFVAPSD